MKKLQITSTITFVSAWLVGLALAASGPKPSDTAHTIATYYGTHEHTAMLAHFLIARRAAAFPRWLATGGLWFAPLLALSGTAFPLNSSAIYATLELTLIGLLAWVIASTVAVARRTVRATPETAAAVG